MRIIIFAHYFNLTSQFVIRTLDELELTNFFVLLNVLPKSALSALVVALNDFKQAPFVVRGDIFKYQD